MTVFRQDPVVLLLAIFLTGCGKQENDSLVYTKENGEQTRDITELDGKAGYQMIGEGEIPVRAMELHEQARAKGQAGDYVDAIKLLTEAIAVAPDWPYPHYDMAFTYLLKGDHAEALSKYQDADQLSPDGFFTAKTAVWCLERERNGTFPEGTYLAYVSLEWLEPDKRRDVVEQMTIKLPAFAPAWKEKALLTDDSDAKLEFLDKALALDPDAETYGTLMLNKAALLHGAHQESEAAAMINDLINNESSTYATKALGQEFLKLFAK